MRKFFLVLVVRLAALAAGTVVCVLPAVGAGRLTGTGAAKKTAAAHKSVAKKAAPRKTTSAKTTSTAKTTPKSSTQKPAASKTASAAAKSSSAKSGSKVATARGKGSRKHVAKVKGQAAPTADRINEIQGALARNGVFAGDSTGKWDDSTTEAMKKFQAKRGLNPTGKLDAPTLQKLGLGSETAGMAAPTPPPNSAANRLLSPAAKREETRETEEEEQKPE
jgi:peptidoglycan hydrolase-like protein with peptidoglycan-binding domain